MSSLPRRLAAEALGTAFLLAMVIGSGVMGDELSGDNAAIALLANSIATGTGLVVLILVFGPISGAHFNPAVTLTFAATGGARWREVLPYVGAQIAGALTGAVAAHLMFDLPVISWSAHERSGAGQWIAEAIATFGLIVTIRGTARARPTWVPLAVGAYITSAYWFTASTSFANPAVTLARAATDTFAGIRPLDVPAFVLAQLAGAFAGTAAFRWFERDRSWKGEV
jgi:glycerol uptake facilitator-like aquaporin